MRITLTGLAILCLAGCGELDDAMSTDRKLMTPTGIATIDDVQAVQNAADGAPVDPASTDPAVTAVPPDPATGTDPAAQFDPAAAATGPPPDGTPTQPSGIFGKTTARVVDAQQAKQNPKVVEVENKLSGNDPLTISTSAYVMATSKISTLGFTRALQLHKASTGKNANFAEFQRMAKQNRIEFAKLPPYQMYGYDAEKGGIVILEDKAEKIRLYKENKLPIEEADKKFE